MPVAISYLRCVLLATVCSSLAVDAMGQSPNQPIFRGTAQETIVPSGAQVELVWDEGEFTEGPAPAGDGTVLFSDIGNRIMRFDPRTGRASVFREPSGRANGLMFDARGRLLACEGANGGNRRVSVTESDGTVRALAERYQGKRFNSPNDLAVAPQGRVYFTDPRYSGDEPRELDFEAVFLIEADGTVKLATRDLQKPNGILVSADGRTVYVADNNSAADGNHQLLAFAVQPDGTLHDKRVLFDFGPNRRGIDGMTLDLEGNIYATAGRGEEAGIYVFSPEGKPLALISTPGDPTNCVFGLGDEAKTLYITAGLAPRAGTAGQRRAGLYRVPLAIAGHHVYTGTGEKR